MSMKAALKLTALFIIHSEWLLRLALGVSSRELQASSIPRGWELREALEKLDKEMYDNGPGPDRPFLPDLKNPCWMATKEKQRSDGGGAIQCLPYGMVIGGFHCGAGSMWTALYKHPLVAKSDVSRWHFWAEFDKTMAGYVSGMSRAATKVVTWRNATAAAAPVVAAGSGAGPAAGAVGEVGGAEWLARQQRVILDGSSSTFAFYWSPNVRAHRAFVTTMVPCWDGCSRQHPEGRQRDACLNACYPVAQEADRKVAASVGLPYNDISLPLLVSAVYGKRPPKMVVLLRNPVDRLYSSYWRYAHYRDKFGASPEGFSFYAYEQLKSLRGCMYRNGDNNDSKVGCLLRFETYGLPEERLYFHADQILRGVYVVWLESWLKFFDRRDLLVLRSEDYFAHPLRTFRRVLEFLDLDPDAVRFHGRIEGLAKAARAVGSGGGGGGGGGVVLSEESVRAALAVPEDDRLWESIRDTLVNGETRYAVNRKAALAAEQQVAGGSSTAGGTGAAASVATAEGAAAGGAEGAGPGSINRPPMPPDMRQELADFYRPYNQRLAALLGDPEFIRGWD